MPSTLRRKHHQAAPVVTDPHPSFAVDKQRIHATGLLIRLLDDLVIGPNLRQTRIRSNPQIALSVFDKRRYWCFSILSKREAVKFRPATAFVQPEYPIICPHPYPLP